MAAGSRHQGCPRPVVLDTTVMPTMSSGTASCVLAKPEHDQPANGPRVVLVIMSVVSARLVAATGHPSRTQNAAFGGGITTMPTGPLPAPSGSQTLGEPGNRVTAMAEVTAVFPGGAGRVQPMAAGQPEVMLLDRFSGVRRGRPGSQFLRGTS
jgi:hypothetical protein